MEEAIITIKARKVYERQNNTILVQCYDGDIQSDQYWPTAGEQMTRTNKHFYSTCSMVILQNWFALCCTIWFV